MPRRLEPGENPFREKNVLNAEKRRALLNNPKRERLDDIERFLNERQAIINEETRTRRGWVPEEL